jgi:hypothetical protein
MPGTFFQQVTPQQATCRSLGRSLEFYITPWGFLKGAARERRDRESPQTSTQALHRPQLEPQVKAPSSKPTSSMATSTTRTSSIESRRGG